MIKRILEIGVAVNDIKTSGSKLHDILNAQAGVIIKDDGYGMVAQMFRVGNIEFELMEPFHQGGMIAKFLETRGEGLHHIAFEVDNIVKIVEWMKKNNIGLINEAPIAIEGCKAVFLHPDSFGGVLIELIEGNPKWVADSALPTELQKPVQPQGIGTEGILEVGIFVKNLEIATASYAKVLLLESLEMAEMKSFPSRIRVYRAGNVDLKLIEIKDKKKDLCIQFGKSRPGLNHIILKVNNIQNATAYLKTIGIDFIQNPSIPFYDSKCVLIQPQELSRIPILLKEEVRV